MSVILKKEKIQTNEVVCQKYNRTNVECDVIVPDIKPDIRKVLEISGFISIKDKSVRGNKVYVQGTVNMTVLYIPDGEAGSMVKSLSAVQEFNHAVDVNNHEGGALAVEAEPESFSYTLINSRKVGLRCVMGISVKVTQAKETELATGADGDSICTDTEALRVCSSAMSSESHIGIREQLELPSGKPSISEILKISVFPQSVELSLIENKAIANGQVRVCTLYTSADDGSVQFAEHNLSFSETLDALGAEEDMEGEIEYSVSDLYFEVRDDSDGEPRMIGLDVGLSAVLRGLHIHEFNVLHDAYSLSGETELAMGTTDIEVLVDNTTAQLTHKAPVNIPEGYPEISQICDVGCVASVERIFVENGEITVFGKVRCNVLYLSRSEEQPLCAFENTSDFSHSFTVPEAQADTICDAKVFTEHISYTLGGGSALDLRVVLGLSVRSFKNKPVISITEITVIPPEDNARKPCVVIYFVQKGDSLWKIAKKYHTTVAALMECNNLNCDTIYPGQQIKICRKTA